MVHLGGIGLQAFRRQLEGCLAGRSLSGIGTAWVLAASRHSSELAPPHPAMTDNDNLRPSGLGVRMLRLSRTFWAEAAVPVASVANHEPTGPGLSGSIGTSQLRPAAENRTQAASVAAEARRKDPLSSQQRQ